MRDERELVDVCASCGAEIFSDTEGAYGFGTENCLCASCAIDRGGRYDAARDCWDEAPDLSGLPDEAYGASPHERRRGP